MGGHAPRGCYKGLGTASGVPGLLRKPTPPKCCIQQGADQRRCHPAVLFTIGSVGTCRNFRDPGPHSATGSRSSASASVIPCLLQAAAMTHQVSDTPVGHRRAWARRYSIPCGMGETQRAELGSGAFGGLRRPLRWKGQQAHCVRALLCRPIRGALRCRSLVLDRSQVIACHTQYPRSFDALSGRVEVERRASVIGWRVMKLRRLTLSVTRQCQSSVKCCMGENYSTIVTVV